MASTTKKNIVDVFVDWENIRNRLNDNYIEKITIEQVMEAIKNVANDIGKLRLATFYDDFTLRREEARVIERKPRFRFRNVLRARSGKDQTDPVLIMELAEAILFPQDFNCVLICTGDSNFCEPLRKASIKGIKAYVCAVGADESPDLTSLAPFYPIEKYLGIQLTAKHSKVEQPLLSGLSPKELTRWSKLVSILNGMESTLPFVTISYFLKDIMPSYNIGGLTQDDRWACIETGKEMGIITVEQIDNPARP